MTNYLQVNERQVQTCFFQKHDAGKIVDDVQIILGIALTIIICLGEGGILSPAVMGSTVIGLASITGVVSIIALLREGNNEKSDYASKLITTISFVSFIALIVLGTLVTAHHISPKSLAIIMLGIDLSALTIRSIAKRTCGPSQKRYSCFNNSTEQVA